MRKSRYSDEEIVAAIERNLAGVPLHSIVAELGVSEATFFAWRNRVVGKTASAQVPELHMLRDENAHLKRLVARMTVDS